MENWEEVPQATAAASPADSRRQVIAMVALIIVMLIPLVIKLFTADWGSSDVAASEATA
jgi:hypothetical protein